MSKSVLQYHKQTHFLHINDELKYFVNNTVNVYGTIKQAKNI